jgi:hypothetical protein
VHVHDGQVPARAEFDHWLYCQAEPAMARHLGDWEESTGEASAFVDAPRTAGIVDGAARCWRLRLRGLHENADTLVGPAGRIPTLFL